jgi:hypothetical protein
VVVRPQGVAGMNLRSRLADTLQQQTANKH